LTQKSILLNCCIKCREGACSRSGISRLTTKIPAIQSEAKSLLECEMTFEFIVSTVIWYDLLNIINKVRKTLKSEHITIDFSLKKYVALKVFLTGYRENSYKNA